MRYLLPYLIVMLGFSCQQSEKTVVLETLDSPTKSLMQAVSILDKDIIWVSGHDATFMRSVDGGSSWDMFRYEKIDSLQFRDVHAKSLNDVVLMSAGPGKSSRIFLYSVREGWKETYVMPFEEGFLNTIEFWDNENGLAFGDSFNGELFVLKTTDGGESWTRIDPKTLPAAGTGEGGFAASGTCIALQPEGNAWIGTGAGGNSRVLKTADYGTSWTTFEVPMIKGDAAGITSIRMGADGFGTIVGGDLALADDYTSNTAWTKDGGKTWQLTSHPETKGAFYGSDILELGDRYLWMACGPNGIDYSRDLGETWLNLSTGNYWALELHESGFGIAVGKEGNLARVVIQ